MHRGLGGRVAAIVLAFVLLLTGCNFGSQGNVGAVGTVSGVFLLPSRHMHVYMRHMDTWIHGIRMVLSGAWLRITPRPL